MQVRRCPASGQHCHQSFAPAQAPPQETKKDVPSRRARGWHCWGSPLLSQGFRLVSVDARVSPPNTKARGSSQICSQSQLQPQGSVTQGHRLGEDRCWSLKHPPGVWEALWGGAPLQPPQGALGRQRGVGVGVVEPSEGGARHRAEKGAIWPPGPHGPSWLCPEAVPGSPGRVRPGKLSFTLEYRVPSVRPSPEANVTSVFGDRTP